MRPPRLPVLRTSLSRQFGRPPRRTPPNMTEAFRRLDALAAGNFPGGFDQASDDHVERLARAVAADGLYVVGTYEGKVDPDWYSRSLDQAMAVAGLLYPELVEDGACERFATVRQARTVFLTALAVTSQGVPVSVNASAAMEQYEAWVAEGRFAPRSLGPSGLSIAGNLRRFDRIVELSGGDLDAVADFLEAEFTVGEVRTHAREAGLSINVEGRADDAVWGSIVLGPKIGAFLQNLLGNDRALTIDMWLSRTFGRLTGTNMSTSVPEATIDRAVEAFSTALAEADPVLGPAMGDLSPAALRSMGISDLGEFSRRMVRAWEAHRRLVAAAGGHEAAGAEKRRLGWPYAAQALMRHAALPGDAPETAPARVMMQKVMRRATEVMAQHGTPIGVSGLQAVLWYPEKQLLATLTGRRETSLNVSFADAFRDIAVGRGIDPEVVSRALDEAPRRSTASPIRRSQVSTEAPSPGL